jgi:hypothetical protein
MMRSRYSKARQSARKALTDLVNLPRSDDPAWPRAAELFISKHGPLRDGWAEAEAIEYARRLRDVWKAGMNGREIGAANATLNDIFKAGDPIKGEGPALSADLAEARVAPAPKSLLHELALELLHSKRSLSRCDACGRYFIKEFSRDKTCSIGCAQQHRNEYQSQLMAERRKGNAKRSDR